MPNNPENLTKTDEWKALEAHAKELSKTRIIDLFKNDQQRFETFSQHFEGLFLDYSKNKITQKTKKLLIELAKAQKVEAQRDTMFSGKAINTTENRAVLHMALRGSTDPKIEIGGENISDFVKTQKNKMRTICDQIRSHKDITDVVHIGIGGSDLGPRMLVSALKRDANGPNIHFISNVDGAQITEVLSDLRPQNTMFIVASKTFTTLETMTNAKTAKDWMTNGMWRIETNKHFIALTANPKAAKDFGVKEENILEFRDWVGGRYSLWSVIGLPLAIAIGFDKFGELLGGAKAMDTHFKEAPLAENLPVLMGLIGIWHRNFCGYDSHAILPYSHNLTLLPYFMQQLDMESNGKSVSKDGNKVKHQTGPIIFGGPGTDTQHAFFQLLHQGTTTVPADFIGIIKQNHDVAHQHTHLLANMLAQSEALMRGESSNPEPHRDFAGDKPSNTILLDKLNAYHMGMLLALYEHKVFVQGAIWNINSFDQWGVELGKTLAKEVTRGFKDDPKSIFGMSTSTTGLLSHINSIKSL